MGRFDENRDREITLAEEPSTENIKNAMMEGIHSMSSVTQNPVQQRKTRVSELSIINVNEPVCSSLDYNLEAKNRNGKLQETRTQQRQVQETGKDMQQGQVPGYSSIGKKLRRNRLDNKTNPRWS